MTLYVHRRNLVRPRDVHRCKLGEEAGIGGVGAVVDGHPAASGGDRAVIANAGFDVNDHAFAASVGSKELFLARKHQAYRPLAGPSERGHMGLVVEAAFAAKAASEMRHDDPHAAGGHLQRFADPRSRIVRHLGGGPDSDLVAFPLGHNGARFDRRGVAPVGDVTTLDDVVGRGHSGFDIALGNGRKRCVVAIAHQHVARAVSRPIGMHKWRIGAERGFHIDNHGQWLVFDDDGIDCLLGDGCR